MEIIYIFSGLKISREYFSEYFLRSFDNNFHRFVDILNAWSTYEKYACKFARILFWNVEKKRIHQYQNFHLKNFWKELKQTTIKLLSIELLIGNNKKKREKSTLLNQTFYVQKISRGGKNWEYKRYPRRRCIKMGISIPAGPERSNTWDPD